MAAVTGRARATKTPVFTSTITSVVFNPDWTVPESTLRNEILPAMAANPNYLVQHHMEMTWSSGTPRVRQVPGPWNALGPIKYLLPNLHGVYLHGTPTLGLFKEPRRDFSHGCVRVEDPFALCKRQSRRAAARRAVSTSDAAHPRTLVGRADCVRVAFDGRKLG